MGEFIHIVFSGENLLTTILFLLVLIYWIIVVLGIIDTEFLDFDVDVEVDADLDVDAEIDVDAEGSSGSDILVLNKILGFFNLGKVPFMIFFTFLVTPLWFLTVMTNNLIGNKSILIGLLITIPIFFICLFIAKILTIPFVKLFTSLEKGDEIDDIIGGVGEVRLSANNQQKGQADVMVGKSFFTIFIKTHKDGESVKKGDKVLVIDHMKKEGYYIIEKYNN